MSTHRSRDRRASSDAITPSAAQQRHDELMRVYRDSQSDTTSLSPHLMAHDLAVLQRNFQFIRDDDADLERGDRDWEVRMSVRYYRKLFREYALADLSRYRDGKVGLRWRTEMEVVAGKGQFVCGNKVCDERHGLHSYELLFAYVENGEKKRCLVKVRVCASCARKLFYRKLKEQEKKRKRRKRRAGKEEEWEEQEEEEDQKKRRRSHSDGEEEKKSVSHNSGRDRKKKREEECIHTRCAAINEVETHGLRPVNESSDETETHELAKLLL